MVLKLISWLMVMVMGLLLVVQPVQASPSSPIPTTEVAVANGQNVTLPDLNQFSLSDLPA